MQVNPLDYQNSPRFAFKENGVAVLQLADRLFCLAQMGRSPFVAFFDICSARNEWPPLTLRGHTVVFYVPVMSLRGLYVGRAPKWVEPANPNPLPRRWLDSESWPTAPGGHIVTGDERGSVFDRDGRLRVEIPDATWESHPDELASLEPKNMQGPGDLLPRLLAWFVEGKRINPVRDEIFGPPPERVRSGLDHASPPLMQRQDYRASLGARQSNGPDGVDVLRGAARRKDAIVGATDSLSVEPRRTKSASSDRSERSAKRLKSSDRAVATPTRGRK